MQDPVNKSNTMAVSAYTCTSCMGHGLDATRHALASGDSYLQACDFLDTNLSTWIGVVAGLDEVKLKPELAAFDCRNNRLASLALEQDGFGTAVADAVTRYGADRVGVYLGSSTSGLLNTELAYRERDSESGLLPASLHYEQTHNMSSLGAFVSRALGVSGPCYVISIACASSAKVFASAARAIATGQIDAAIVGGVDSLCLTTLYGFGSLELLSPDRCQPYGVDRNGISIAEAAGFALLEKPASHNTQAALLAGYGESSDAHHMSSPHPQGLGAQIAMKEALARANCETGQIDYVNLHGTATPSNDKAEDAAVYAVFGDRVPVSSTKGVHGHTLGAAGALEACIALLTIESGRLPAGINIDTVDPELKSAYLTQSRTDTVSRVMSNFKCRRNWPGF